MYYLKKVNGKYVAYKKVKGVEKQIVVALDDGHGEDTAGKRTPFIPSLGRSIRENEFNDAVVAILAKLLEANGFKVILTAPGGKDETLVNRTNKANRAEADIFLSIHFNAMGTTFAYSKAQGFSVHIQPHLAKDRTSASYQLAKVILEELAKGTPQVNRGIVGQNLHVTRETKMPAVLIECGFMDDEREALLMINREFHLEVANELHTAVCRYFAIPKQIPEKAKPEPVKGLGVATVKTDGLALRKGPGFSHGIIRQLKKHERYVIYGVQGMWYKLGANQWASAGAKGDHLHIKLHSAKPEPKATHIGTAKIKVPFLNLRTGPSVRFPLVEGRKPLQKNEVYRVYKEQNGWLNVGAGWISNVGNKYAEFTRGGK